jgi:hypothetical protein
LVVIALDYLRDNVPNFPSLPEAKNLEKEANDLKEKLKVKF